MLLHWKCCLLIGTLDHSMAVAHLVLAVAAPLVRALLVVAITKQLKDHLHRQPQPITHLFYSLALLQVSCSQARIDV